MTHDPIITSFLDTDLYKITMQAAIHKHYPKVPCKFLLTNRTPDKKLSKEAYEWFCQQVKYLGNLEFTDDDIAYLESKIGYLGKEHFAWLKTVKLNPDGEIEILPEISDDGLYSLRIIASGDWEVVTLYELPMLSLLSECYFKFMDTKWTINNELIASYDNGVLLAEPQFNIADSQAFDKTCKLLNAGCVFSEFGTRRRRSFQVQKAVMEGIMRYVNSGTDYTGKFLGTSNVLFAKEFNVEPIGTIGHEWMMGVGAVQSIKTANTETGEAVNYNAYITANRVAMEQYVALVGPSHAGLALTDTYGTDNYLAQFEEPYIGYYIGVRQDSGDPEVFAKKLSKWYNEKGYCGPNAKMICFSDSLNVEKCIKLKAVCDGDDCKIKCCFGIGTNLTNDFDSEPMNIVMKLLECGGGHAIKISDNISKNMGDAKTLFEVKKLLGYVEHDWVGADEAHRWKK